jgi:gas vesicle protein
LKSAGLLSTGKSGKENNQVIMYDSMDEEKIIQIQQYLDWINTNYHMSSNSLSTGIKP